MDKENEIIYDNNVLQRLRNYLNWLGKDKLMIICGDLEWKASEIMDEVNRKTPFGKSAYLIWVETGERGL